MNRIKYPEEQEIKRQIHMILDQSGMFEDEEKDETYAECVQVKKKPGLKTAILFPMAAAAVMCLIVAAAKMLPEPTISETEPMTNVLTDDTIRTVSKTELNQNISVEICTESYVFTVSYGQSQDFKDVEFYYSYPKVYYQGEEVTEITEYYSSKIKQIEENAKDNYQFERNLDTETIQQSGAPVKLSYHCSAVSGITTDSNNLVTIYENYSENVRYKDAYATVNQVYGSNFDAATGHQFAMAELFTDAEKGFAEVTDFLKENAQTSNLQQILDSGAWYLGQNGLTLCVNDVQGEEKKYSDMRYRNTYSEAYVIAYSSLTGLKEEYRNP